MRLSAAEARTGEESESKLKRQEDALIKKWKKKVEEKEK